MFAADGSSADIVVSSVNEPGFALIVEVKSVVRPAEPVERQLKQLMVHVRASTGMLVTPDAITIFRETFRDYTEDSVQLVGTIRTESIPELQAFASGKRKDPFDFEHAVEIFPLSDRSLELSVDISFRPDLAPWDDPFDQAVLAAVLGRAEELPKEDASAELFFCELDGHQQPWDKNGERRHALAAEYDTRGVWVYGNFDLQGPTRPTPGDAQ